jgi:hypothetical protein
VSIRRFSDRKEHTVDIVVQTHIPSSSGIDFSKFKEVLETLLKAIYPQVEIVAFLVGTENPQGVNALQVKTIINKGTKDQLEDSLREVFGQKFEISCNGENAFPVDIDIIVKATAPFL